MTDPVSQPDRDAIRARFEKATPGPWEALTDWSISAPHTNVAAMSDGRDSRYWGDRPTGQGRPDAEFIAHARTDIPALLGALEAAEAERDALRAVLSEWVAAWDDSERLWDAEAAARRAVLSEDS